MLLIGGIAIIWNACSSEQQSLESRIGEMVAKSYDGNYSVVALSPMDSAETYSEFVELILDAWPKWYKGDDSLYIVKAINEKKAQITDMQAPLFRTYLLMGLVKDQYGIEQKVTHYVQTDGLTDKVIQITQDKDQLYIHYSCFPRRTELLESYKVSHNIK